MEKKQIICPHCDHEPFRNQSGLDWHLKYCHEARLQDGTKADVLKSPALTNDKEPNITTKLNDQIDELFDQIEWVWAGLDDVEDIKDGEIKELQKSINDLETIVQVNDARISQLKSALAEFERKFELLINNLEKKLIQIVERHYHQSVMLPDGKTEQKVQRRDSYKLAEIFSPKEYKV